MINESNNSFPDVRGNDISISINGKFFPLSSFFSMQDMGCYINALEQNNGDKFALASTLHCKLQQCNSPIPTLDEVYMQSDEVFEDYVRDVISNNLDLKHFFDSIDVSMLLLKQFSKAILEYQNEYEQSMEQCSSQMSEPIFAIKRITGHLGGVKGMTGHLSGVKRITGHLGGVKGMTGHLSGINGMMTGQLATIKKMCNLYSTMLASIQIPSVTEEDKKRLETIYQVWGSMGWSVIPRAPAKLFHYAPENIKEADSIARRYFSKECLADLFTQMKEQRINKEDLCSAINCFENRQYKASALLIFGIIDAKLIRLQSKADNKKKRRVVGKRAVEQLEGLFTEQGNTERCLFSIVQFAGLVECLTVFFADGQDFRTEPPVINRNFVGHGMNQRPVRRKDCVKLFLALYNLAYFLGNK